MSYHIKPEDVPEEFFNRASTDFLSVWEDEALVDVAGILNAAIEAGLVSPPCYALRKPDNGGLLTQHRVYTSRESANDAAPYRHNVEHWKGQTE